MCITTKQITSWFSAIMVVYFLVFLVMCLTQYRYSRYLPTEMLQECIPVENYNEDDYLKIVEDALRV